MRFSVLSLVSGAAFVALSTHAGAQLTDLQPGRNFVVSSAFGLNRSENIDPGDIDNDGDFDVLVANGGDFAAEPNRIFVNNGGLQAGTVGTFTEGTAARLAGAPSDTSRDGEFMDADNDGDIDIYISNRGNTVNGGEPSRFYINKGGLQAGTIGFYQEETNTRWGTLISVPADKQVLGGNVGPFRDFTCDCDFADLNDDGNTDLFHSSYGPNIDGSLDSRIFLNSGAGVFNEMWPWANASADTKTHTIDFDPADMDGDFDIDIVMSSRNSQARTYMNNLYNGVSASAFQDITQSAFIANGATSSATVNYEGENGDVDGDGDFDIWFKNYDNNLDRILINNGFVAGVGYNFTKKTTWIKGDPNQDENEIDFGDYDNDGDLDAFVANFSGTSSLYQSGLAQGLNGDTQGMYHNTGVGGTGNLATAFPEVTTNWNMGTQLDMDWVDTDNDGDLDMIVAADGNQQNRLVTNVLGVPDTHAPTFYKVTQQGSKANGTDTVIHAEFRDNLAAEGGGGVTDYYPATLKYTIDLGSEQSVPMFHMGGMELRGVIPAQTDAVVRYHVVVSDMTGNTGTSAQTCFSQGTPTNIGTFTDIGSGLAGITGIPVLAGGGIQIAGCPASLTLSNARVSSPAVLFAGIVNSPTAFKGGFLVPVPFLIQLPLTTSGAGTIPINFNWPNGVPSAFSIYYQYGIKDAVGPVGVSLSNALQSTTP